MSCSRGEAPHAPHQVVLDLLVFRPIGKIDHLVRVIAQVVEFVEVEAVVDVFEVA